MQDLIKSKSWFIVASTTHSFAARIPISNPPPQKSFCPHLLPPFRIPVSLPLRLFISSRRFRLYTLFTVLYGPVCILYQFWIYVWVRLIRLHFFSNRNPLGSVDLWMEIKEVPALGSVLIEGCYYWTAKGNRREKWICCGRPTTLLFGLRLISRSEYIWVVL